VADDESRFRGCLLAGAVGDALGAPVEFLPLEEIVERFGPDGPANLEEGIFPAGSFTDDTQMTLFVAEGLIRMINQKRTRDTGPNINVMLNAHWRWLTTQAGPNLWRLEQNPMFTEMAAYKDTVEGDFNEYGVFVVQRVVGESGLRTIRTGVPKRFYFSDFGKAFLDRVMKAGGMWEIVFWGILILNLPEGQADELGELFLAACLEAECLSRTEKKGPNLLYGERPEGGANQREEN